MSRGHGTEGQSTSDRELGTRDIGQVTKDKATRPGTRVRGQETEDENQWRKDSDKGQ